MFISTTSSDYSIMDCPPIRPLLMDTTTKWKSNKIEVAPNCPRCASSNTKFCYYNNYSLSQPRYFCKACRRYWTKGGSLRNVPVGGGCRKTRRARAARQGGGGTVSYTGTILSPTRAEPTNESIDLAAVFAKYLNPNVENEDQSCSPGASCASSENVQASSLDLDHQIEDFAAFDQNHESLDLVNGADSQSQLMIPQVSTHDINCQDFVYQNCEMQGILDDHELAGDILWSDVTNLPNFESQQSTVQIQDFGLFLPDDQLRISANLVHDNWSSFDLSGYEIFSRP